MSMCVFYFFTMLQNQAKSALRIADTPASES